MAQYTKKGIICQEELTAVGANSLDNNNCLPNIFPIPKSEFLEDLFDKPQFESMKRMALLINQVRGKVENEEALI